MAILLNLVKRGFSACMLDNSTLVCFDMVGSAFSLSVSSSATNRMMTSAESR